MTSMFGDHDRGPEAPGQPLENGEDGLELMNVPVLRDDEIQLQHRPIGSIFANEVRSLAVLSNSNYYASLTYYALPSWVIYRRETNFCRRYLLQFHNQLDNLFLFATMTSVLAWVEGNKTEKYRNWNCFFLIQTLLLQLPLRYRNMEPRTLSHK